MGKCIYLRKGETHTKPVSTIYAASLNIGDVVKLNEGGVMTEFIVVNQGLPDGSLYDISCNGTWLLRKDILDRLAWHNSNSNIYASSDINAKLNSDYINGLGPLEQSLIKQVKIPYVNGTGSGGSVASGSDGLSVKAFLLGGYEVGFTTTTSANFPVDGTALSYFAETADTDTKRIANYNGAAGTWRLRSPDASTIGSGWLVNVYGASASSNVSNVHGIRPCIILPFTAEFDSETKELVGNANGLPYLMFTSPESFTLSVNNATKNWDGTLQYSTDTTNWAEWDGTTTLSSVNNKLYLRGTGNTRITGGITNNSNWVLTGSNISCIGNIENLLDHQTVLNGEHPTMTSDCYSNMFSGCKSLVTAPELPATTLTFWCYTGMFASCTSLTTAPKLPATTLAGSCYSNMFAGCTSLITAPELPATNLASYCYNYMFVGTSLTTAPKLPATTLADSCYDSMFSGCKSLVTVPELPATTLVDYCYNQMFYSCSKIKLSATRTGTYTQEYRIPVSGSGTTATNALVNMFANTGGTFTGTPSINTTYYLDSSNYIV